MRKGKTNVQADLTVGSGATIDEFSIDGTLIDNSDTAVPTEQAVKTYVDTRTDAIPSFKSFTLAGGGLSADTYYLAGYYDVSATDANLTESALTITYGSENIAYGAHAILVAGGAGSASGGTGTVEIEVSGTSITDAGVRTASDTEIIVADITASTLNQYYETSKKWIGIITYTIQNSGGSTHTTFSLDFNYGFCKYEDFGNRDFQVTDFEVVGVGGANDLDFNIQLLKHSSTGWTYSVAAFDAGGTVIADMNTDYGTEQNLSNTEDFAYKRAGLATVIGGADSEGVIIKIITGNNSAVRTMDAHIGITL